MQPLFTLLLAFLEHYDAAKLAQQKANGPLTLQPCSCQSHEFYQQTGQTDVTHMSRAGALLDCESLQYDS